MTKRWTKHHTTPGKFYGKVEVLDFAEGGKDALFKCHHCGSHFITRLGQVVTGYRRSCGCLKHKPKQRDEIRKLSRNEKLAYHDPWRPVPKKLSAA